MSEADHTEVINATTATLRDTVAALEQEESRLATSLATVRQKRVAVAKALEALADTTPRRRRGRPRKSEQPAGVAA